MKSAITFLMAILLMARVSFAQSASHTLNVFVSDSTKTGAIELAVVQLIDSSDNKSIGAGVTNKKGRIEFEKISIGTYLLRCSFSGFIPVDSIINITAHSSRSVIISIALKTNVKKLGEVVVNTRRSLLNTSVDRKVYYVSQDILAQTGSVSDVLKNIPSVEVDIDGNVSLRGSGDVMILINGRPSPLMGRNKAEVLQQIPANTIERIEVITNPSARFRPDGTSGIINIILKKNSKTGLNGTVTGNIGNRERSNASLNLNLRQGKFNWFTNYSFRQEDRNRFGRVERQSFDSSGKLDGIYKESSRVKSRPVSHFITGGFEWEIDKKNSVGLSGSTLPNHQKRNDRVMRSFYDAQNILYSRYDRTRFAPAKEWERNASFFWQHNFDNDGHEIRFEANTSSDGEDEQNYYSNIFYTPTRQTQFDNNWVYQTEKNKQITLDYVKPIGDDAQLELGYAGSFMNSLIDFYVEQYDTTLRKFIKNPAVSNIFRYKDGLHAVYGTYERTYGDFSFNAGLRAEAAFTNSILLTLDSNVRNDYFQLYPTIHLALKREKGEWQLNYSRRVNRPDPDELNPFPEYLDPLNLRAGNPKLQPEYIHSIEFGYQISRKYFSFVPSIYYRYKYNGFTSVTRALNDSVFFTTRENLSNDKSAGLELIFSTKALKFGTVNLNTNIFYNSIDASALGSSSKRSIVTMSNNLNALFTITKSTMLQLAAIYRSARQTAQGRQFSTFVMNIGARQNLFNNKLTVACTLSDIFRTLQQRTLIESDYFIQNSYNRRDAQVFYLGLSYRFGKTPKKQQEEKLQFDNNL
jgi:outer membrane receptor protein involved in Fe transport